MPQQISPEIREALQRRASGEIAGAGAQAPVGEQMGAPTGETPTGGPNVPVTPPPPAPTGQNTPPGAPPAQQAVNQALSAGQTAQSPIFDDETKKISKALIAKLLQTL